MSSMSSRVHFFSWGRRAIPDGYVVLSPSETVPDAIRRRVERVSGHTIIVFRHDGTAIERGRPVAEHYQITLGDPVARRYGGGYSVVGELWVGVRRH